MKYILKIFIATILLTIFSSSAYAVTPEEICQARKSMEISRFTACRHKVLSKLPESKFRLSNNNCRRTFNKRWRRATKRAESLGGTCHDAPLGVEDFGAAIRTHINSITFMLGRNQKGIAAKRRCRAIKTVATGRYAACRHRAESGLARTSDTNVYDTRIAGCEANLESAWSKIINRTAKRGTTCFDDERSISEYKTAIDSHTEKVSGVLRGADEFGPLSLNVTGSPLVLVTDGAAKSITIKNTSEKATVVDIEADFSGTALEGKVSETENTCSSVAPGASCTLTFTAGSTLVSITEFTIQGSNTEAVSASIEIVAPATATLSVDGSPLSLTVDGPTGDLTVTNTSATTALDVASDLTGTALDGNIVESANTCSSVAPGASCTLTFTPGGSVVSTTEFTVKGSNTVTLTPSISVQSGSTLTAVNMNSGPASGGTGITLTGTGLTGTTLVTFSGIEATSVNVVNSTTVTAVTPAHAAGIVDIAIDTPAGGATLANGYEYVPTTVGQSSGGGVIACLNGGFNNLIAAKTDISDGVVVWGGFGTAVGANSDHNGAANTTTIVAALGNNNGTPYAAQLCNDYEVDSQGNTPCQAGNACYGDWFLPAGNNLTDSGQLNCLFNERFNIGGFSPEWYWSSTEYSPNPTNEVWPQSFSTGNLLKNHKLNLFRVRCVRAFTP